MAGKKKQSLLTQLLGPVPEPKFAAGADYRDAADEVGDAVVKAARLDPKRFYAVLARQPALLEVHDVVWALGYVRDRRAVAPLVIALGSRSSTTRSAAANGLGQYRDPASVEPLIRALKDRSPTIRLRVVEALRKQRSPLAVPALRDALTRPSNQKESYLLHQLAEAIAALTRGRQH